MLTRAFDFAGQSSRATATVIHLGGIGSDARPYGVAQLFSGTRRFSSCARRPSRLGLGSSPRREVSSPARRGRPATGADQHERPNRCRRSTTSIATDAARAGQPLGTTDLSHHAAGNPARSGGVATPQPETRPSDNAPRARRRGRGPPSGTATRCNRRWRSVPAAESAAPRRAVHLEPRFAQAEPFAHARRFARAQRFDRTEGPPPDRARRSGQTRRPNRALRPGWAPRQGRAQRPARA